MTDIETERLREAVVENALNYWAFEECIAPWTEMAKSVVALRDHLAKAAPEPAPRCEPPEEFRGRRGFHWLGMGEDDEAPTAAEWTGRNWFFCGSPDFRSPTDAYADGWRYHSPATPDTRVMPTISAVRDFLVKIGYSDTGQNERLVFAAFAHFSPVQQTDENVPEAIEIGDRIRSRVGRHAGRVAKVIGIGPDGGLKIRTESGGYLDYVFPDDVAIYDKASWGIELQPAGVQHITDEEIIDLWSEARPTMLDVPGAVKRFARSLMAKHSPTLSDSLLLQLRDIALTRDGPNQYLSDARIRLAGVGK